MMHVGISLGVSGSYCNANKFPKICPKICPESSRESSRESPRNVKSCSHSEKDLTYGGDGSKRYCFCNICKKTIDNGYN